MRMRELVMRARSCRRFNADTAVPPEFLEELVELARCTGSAMNLQPLKYVLSCAADMNARIFRTLGWAAYLPHWPGPAEHERPTAYVVLCLDTDLAQEVDCDHGIAAQTMLLAAAERGLGGCILGSVNREKLARELDLPPHLRILLVLALGRCAENHVLEPLGADGSVKYYRDVQGVHHVPKRSAESLIAARFY